MTMRMAARMMGAEQKGRGVPAAATAAASAASAAAADSGGAAGCTAVHSETLMKTPSAIRESGICISENCAAHPTAPLILDFCLHTSVLILSP